MHGVVKHGGPLRLSGWLGGVLFALFGPAPAAWAQAARQSPELVACVAANRQAALELGHAQDGGIRRHAMHPLVVTRLQGLGGQVTRLRETTARNPRNLADCEQTTQAIASAREQLERIVGTPALVVECVANNQQLLTEVQGTLRGLQTAGKTPVAMLETAAGRLEALRVALAREGPTLADCRQLAGELAEERSQLQRLSPTAAAAPARPSTAGALAPATQAAPAAPVQAPASPPAAACREGHGRSYNELATAYAQLVGGGVIPPEWMAPLQSLSERLTRLRAVIANTAEPGWECNAITRALEQARSDMSQLVRR